MSEVLLFLMVIYYALGFIVWFMMFLAELKKPTSDIPIWSPMMIASTLIIWPMILKDQLNQRRKN